MKKIEANVLHKIRNKVIRKLSKLKVSQIIKITLKMVVEINVYLKNHPQSLIFCFPWISSICSRLEVNMSKRGRMYATKVVAAA